MDIRYSTGKEPFKRMTTEEIRDEFLIENIFIKNDVTAVYSHIDRIVTLGCMPVDETVKLDKNIDAMKDFGVDFFLQRRELGMINIGGDGVVVADGKTYEIKHYDALYLGAGTKVVTLTSKDAKKSSKILHELNTGSLHLPKPNHHL